MKRLFSRRAQSYAFTHGWAPGFEGSFRPSGGLGNQQRLHLNVVDKSSWSTFRTGYHYPASKRTLLRTLETGPNKCYLTLTVCELSFLHLNVLL